MNVPTFERSNVSTSPRSNVPTFERSNALDLSIIIVNWNTRDLLADCLRSVYDTVHGLTFEVFVVDNASSDGSAAMVRQRFPQVQLIENSENVGFARANNQAIERSSGRYAVLLNSDVIVLDGALANMVRFLDKFVMVGMLGCQLLNADGSLQGSFADYPSLWSAALGRDTRRHIAFLPGSAAIEVDAVSGACMMVRRETWLSVGCLDDSYWLFAEEVDWCYRIRKAGWKVCLLPSVRIVHLLGQSRKNISCVAYISLHRSRLKFFRDHYGPISHTALLAFYVLSACAKCCMHLPPAKLRGVRSSQDAWVRSRALLRWLCSGRRGLWPGDCRS